MTVEKLRLMNINALFIIQNDSHAFRTAEICNFFEIVKKGTFS